MLREESVAREEPAYLIEQAHYVLARSDARDRSRQDVIEHQRGHAELRHLAAECFLHHAIHATAREHRAALDVNGADREREQHHAENEPRRGLAYVLLDDAACVVSG